MAEKKMAPVFVVGTGRCGSTLISRLINQHADILSLSEFFTFLWDFGGRVPQTFSDRKMTGEEFWEMISPVMPRTNMLAKHDVAPNEYLYPFREAGHHFNSATGVPAISLIALPHLTSNFDQLYDELSTAVPKQPAGGLRAHYDALFNWLMQRFHKNVWVERSGGTFLYFDELTSLYPDARFMHILRDGRDVAISMQNHAAFRIFMLGSQIAAALGYDPFETDRRDGIEALPPELSAFLPEHFDRDTFLGAEYPLETMGDLWSQMIETGLEKLAGLPQEQVMTVSYARLCAAPEEELASIVKFIGVDASDAWLQEVAAEVRPGPNRWRELPKAERNKLEAACAPGMELIAHLL
jgi:putative sulfotransferase